MDAIKSGVVGRTVWKIYHDSDAESPREWDNLGTFTVRHGSRYGTSDRWAMSFASLADAVAAREELEELRPKFEAIRGVARDDMTEDQSSVCDEWEYLECRAFFGVVLWAHSDGSGVCETSDAAGANCAFYADSDAIRKEYGSDDAEAMKRAEACLRGELTDYRAWAEGDVFGYMLERDGANGDSCWGFYGLQDATAEAINAATWHEKKEAEAESDYAARC